MRRERCNRGRDGVPEHIMTSVNNSPSPPRGVRRRKGVWRNWVSEDRRGRVMAGGGGERKLEGTLG